MSVDLPVPTLRRAKTMAAAKGMTLKQLVAEAVKEKVQHDAMTLPSAAPPWMKGFGGLADLKGENARILRIIEEEFEQVESETRS